MSEPTKAVFLSYASQDAEAARKICDALRAAGVEVWFDADGGLEHGDEWDAKIRRQIKECVLFIPIISANTQAREEGYFRIEWELAAERAMGIASGVAFILPVVIDDTREPDALVPDRFRKVQWTRLRDGTVPPEVLQRFLKLWSHRTGALKHEAAHQEMEPGRPRPGERGEGAASPVIPKATRRVPAAAWIGALVIALGLVSFVALRPKPNAGAGTRPPTSEKSAAPSEADQLIVRAYAFFGKMNYTRDKLAAAEDLTRKATEIASDSARAWAARAYVQSSYILRGWDTGEKRREDTQTFANRALALDANETTAMLALTYVLNRQRAFAQAETLARRAIALRPDDYRPRTALTTAVVGQGRTAEALAIAQENVRLFPREPLTHYDLALGYLIRGDLETALAGFEAALAVQPFASALLQKTTLLVLVRHDVPAARATLDQLAPDDRTEDRAVGVALWLALVERNPARVQEAAGLTARNYFEDTVVRGAKAWSLAFAYQLAGKESLARQQWQAAEVVLRQRLRDHPEATDDQARLAVTLAWLGRTDEAAREIAPWESAAREQPSPRSAYLLAQYYTALGDAAKAAPYLAQAMKLRPFVSKNSLRLDPQWDKLRGQPEFEALLTDPKKETTASATVADEKSVAVLAFANLSDDKDNEYFSDGISEELLNVLAKIPGLKVSARTSAFYFKGKQVPLPEIARQLGVAYVIEGSVRKQGTKVRITAQLIKAADGFHVWSDTFTRELKDIFAVQDEIAGLIAKNLELKMGMTPARPTIDVEAYQEYLAGRAAAAKASMADLREAVTHFERAVAVEPKFTAAWVQLASAHTRLGRWGGVPTRQAWPAARAAIAKAQALEPDSPDVLLALGWILRTADWDWRGAEQAFRRSLQLQPNQPDALTGAAVLLFNIGQTEEAFRLGRQAAQLDPLNASTQFDLSLMFYFNNNWAESERSARRALQLAPGGSFHGLLSFSLIKQKRYAEAEAEARLESDELEQTNALSLLALARGQDAAVRECRARLEVIARKRGDDSADLQINFAWIDAALGDKDRAFAALEKARASRDSSMAWLRNDENLAPLYSDPRWGALLHKVGLADEQLK